MLILKTCGIIRSELENDLIRFHGFFFSLMESVMRDRKQIGKEDELMVLQNESALSWLNAHVTKFWRLLNLIN